MDLILRGDLLVRRVVFVCCLRVIVFIDYKPLTAYALCCVFHDVYMFYLYEHVSGLTNEGLEQPQLNDDL
jgi:hypothetical protein